MKKTISEQAKEFRLSKNWSPTEMARHVGCNRFFSSKQIAASAKIIALFFVLRKIVCYHSSMPNKTASAESIDSQAPDCDGVRPDGLAWVLGEPACSEISGICSNQAGKRWTLLLPRPQQPRAHTTRWCCTHRELKTGAERGAQIPGHLKHSGETKALRAVFWF